MQGEEYKEHEAFKIIKWFHLSKTFLVQLLQVVLSNRNNKSKQRPILFFAL